MLEYIRGDHISRSHPVGSQGEFVPNIADMLLGLVKSPRPTVLESRLSGVDRGAQDLGCGKVLKLREKLGYRQGIERE